MTGFLPSSATPLSRALEIAFPVAFGAGIAMLRLVDARAENFWAFAGPAFILAAYLALGSSILARKD